MLAYRLIKWRLISKLLIKAFSWHPWNHLNIFCHFKCPCRTVFPTKNLLYILIMSLWVLKGHCCWHWILYNVGIGDYLFWVRCRSKLWTVDSFYFWLGIQYCANFPSSLWHIANRFISFLWSTTNLRDQPIQKFLTQAGHLSFNRAT